MAKTRYVRADADGAGNGTTSSVGGPNGAWTWAQFLADLPVSGDDYHIKGPFTYTLAAKLDFWSGGATQPIIIEGWNTTPGDNPTGADRPRIACGMWEFDLGGYTYFKNFRITISDRSGCYSDGPSTIVMNCSSDNSGPGWPAAFSGFGGVWIDCDATSRDSGFRCSGKVIGCYTYDSDIGIDSMGTAYIRGCILENCIDGIWDSLMGAGTVIQENTFYDCSSKCIRGYDDTQSTILSNIFDTGDDGVWWEVVAGIVWLDFNNFDNLSGSKTVNVSDGHDVSYDDPPIFNAPTLDFRLGPDIKGQGFPKFNDFFRHILGTNLESWSDQGALQRREIIGEAAAVRETGANARSGGSCVKLSPTSTSDPMSWVFLIPCSNGQSFACFFWHKISVGFNGQMDFSASGCGITPIDHANVPFVDDGSYHEFASDQMNPTSDGHITIMVHAYDGVVSGDIFMDDIETIVLP